MDAGRVVFRNRIDAGRALGVVLAGVDLDRPLLVGLARGGVPVAVAAAAVLGEAAEVDVGVARKVTRPGRPEAGLGAVASDGEPVWFTVALERQGLTPDALAGAVAEERAEARRREAAYGATWRERAPGRDVVLVDDGVATGVTALAALRALEAAGPSRLVLGAPVIAATTAERLAHEWGGEVVAVTVPPRFRAVGDHYEDFGQLSDDDVRRALGRG
ncbi:phosphoribosyltransferase family protein [Actinomycetospora sp. TBRC 11914]|uniref:phosphoribosyltransferase family protein n=1 Tax=Actinomycetospora sp. TBRC 11914 TaxID=2729387 RepID=UPI00145DB3C6|nr:phosphoribosyltransferase family protein [Actinomycetospora sp. TBRC 11914]NMO88964.1 phosphoribosyltransferase [Actinomycetospora sp. TBRC 11914]